MAIDPLDKRLDKLNQESADIDQRVDLASQAPVDQPVETLGDTQPTFEDPSDGVQVAGLASVVKQVAKGVAKVEIRKAPKAVSKAAQEAADLQDLQKASEMTEVGTKMDASIAGKVEQQKQAGMTPEAVVQKRSEVAAKRAAVDPATEVPPVTQFNLPRIETSEDVKSTIEAINQMAGIKTENITFKDVEEAAKVAGIGPKFIDDLIKGKLQVDPKNTYMALNAMSTSAKKLDDLADKAARSVATPQELAEFAQTIHFHSVLQQSVKGYQTNVAQSLAVMRIPRDSAAQMSEVLAAFGDETDMTKFAQRYLSLKDPMARAEMIKGAAQGNTYEKLFTVYINGLLSRPTTHIKNIVSNTVFMPWRLTERGTAAGIGAIRQAVNLGSQDAYKFKEIPAILASTPTAFRNAWELASYSFKEGVPKGWTDPVKIARQQSRMDVFNTRADGSLLSAGLKALNYVTTLPGRSLMTADEFFKGLNYTNELAAEATRLQISTFDEAIKAGKTASEAEGIAANALDEFLLEPPDYIAAIAETGTFTQKLEGTASKIQNALQPNTALGFAARTQMPFISTPVNVMGEGVSRTPFAAFSPNVWRSIKAGGKEGDMAIAKVGLGSAAMYTFSEFAKNNNLTGSGPGDRGTRDAMMRQGWQPYSMVFDMDNVDEEFRQAMSALPMSVKYGSGDYSGKVFVSYQGMEPVGALMAISADYVDYVKYEDDDSRVNAYVGGAVFGIGNYMLESPFLQGISNIASLLGGQAPNNRQNMIQMLNGIAEMGTTTVLKSVQPLTGATTSVKEKVDPTIRDYRSDPNQPAGLKGLMDALNKWRSDTPGLSQDLPPKLNIWGESSDYEYAYAPWRMKDGKQRPVDQALIQLNANVSMPTREVSTKDVKTGISTDVKLTTQEYNAMLKIANEDYNLEQNVMTVIDSIKADDGNSDLIRYQQAVKRVFTETFSAAKEKLARDSEYSDAIQKRLSDKAEQLKEFGQGAK